MSVAPESGRNRIMIYGPKNDGTYIVEFTTAAGEALAISVPAGETRVLEHFQARMPFGAPSRTRRGHSGPSLPRRRVGALLRPAALPEDSIGAS